MIVFLLEGKMKSPVGQHAYNNWCEFNLRAYLLLFFLKQCMGHSYQTHTLWVCSNIFLMYFFIRHLFYEITTVFHWSDGKQFAIIYFEVRHAEDEAASLSELSLCLLMKFVYSELKSFRFGLN